MSRFCDKCGHELKNENAKFCDKCGNKVNKINNSSSVSKTTYSCPYCGKTIPYATKCPYCGKSFKNDDARKCGLGVIGIFLLIILISGLCGFLLILFG